jgi:hypothetical protein
MRTITALAVLTVALVLPATGATAPGGDKVKGGPCADITVWDPELAGPPVYTTRPAGTATVYAQLTTAKPSCSGTPYTITVYDASGTTVLNSQTFTGDGTTSSFSYAFSPPGAPSQVCIAASSNKDGKVLDAAPDTGCYVMVLDTSPGGSGLN